MPRGPVPRGGRVLILLLACAEDPSDRDGDTFLDAEDCAPDAPLRYPGAQERCDGFDDDCDGTADDGLPTTWYYIDGDGDGFGAEPVEACQQFFWMSETPGDCDDRGADVHPGADEACDEVDSDCDGSLADGPPGASWRDADGDGYGDERQPLDTCPGEGAAARAGDCDDARRDVHPGAAEVCAPPGADEDCDGLVDDADAVPRRPSWYRDADGDGYGEAGGEPIVACERPLLRVAGDGDCDDAADWIHPSAEEPPCNHGVDHDCDGRAWNADGDHDGFDACVDCDDGLPWVHPGAPERCDHADDDCDGQVDEGLALSTWYADIDGDGHGDPYAPVVDCGQPPGTVARATDCDDTASTVHPGAPESCATAADDDCDGSVNAWDAFGCAAWFADLDLDGYGAAASGEACLCDAAAPYTAAASDGEDCDDADRGVHPSAAESCDGVDSDCDGSDDCTVSELPIYLAGALDMGLGQPLAANVGDLDLDGVDDVLVASTGAGAGFGQIEAYAGPVTATAGEPFAWWTGASLAGRVGSAMIAFDADEDGSPDLFVGDRAFEDRSADHFGVVAWLRAPGEGDQGTVVSAATMTWYGDRVTGDVGASLAGSASLVPGLSVLVVGAADFDTSRFGQAVLLDPLDTSTREAAGAAVASVVGTRTAPVGAAVASGQDLDGDGFDEVVVAGSDGIWWVHAGPLSGVVPVTDAERIVRMAAPSHAAMVPDVDGDGLGDLLLEGSDEVAVFVGAMGGTERGPQDFLTFDTEDGGVDDGSPSLVLDLDQDGAQDLVTRRPGFDAVVGSEGEVLVFLGPLAGALAPEDTPYRWTGSAADACTGAVLVAVQSGGERPSVLISGFEDLRLPPAAGVLYLLEGSAFP